MRSVRRKPRERHDEEPLEWLSQYCDEHGQTTPDREVDGMAADSFPASDPPSFSGARAGCPSTQKAPVDYVGGVAPPRTAAARRRGTASGRARKRA